MNDITVKIPIAIIPFEVPECVYTRTPPVNKIDGFEIKNTRIFLLSELDEETLSRLCAEFRDGVFAKARVTPPPTCKAGV